MFDLFETDVMGKASNSNNCKDVAVVIVSWNVKALLAECLASVFESLVGSNLDAKVWVVDNASHDGSAQMVREQFPQVRLIASPKNLGFAGGNNCALRALGFGNLQCALDSQLPRYILLLNPDTKVHSNALATMVDFMDERPSVGVCGPRLLYGDGSFQHSAFGFPDLAQILLDFFPLHWRLTESRLNGRYARRLYEGEVPFEVDHPLGAAMMLRQEVLLQTGLFDEGYRMYVEEIDWCMRIRRAGWDIYCVPSAVIVHHAGQSTQQVRNQMFVALWRSRFRLFGKHYSRAFCWAARRLVRLGLRAEASRARAAHRCGDLSAQELAGWLSALHQVRRESQNRS